MFGCGQCLPCRISRRRIWTTRLIIETLSHSKASFVTLTYAVMPKEGSLEPKDLKLFLKRLRRHVGKLRYYACGEYSEKNTQRPHYHLIIWGHLLRASLVRKIWGKGHVFVGEANEYTCQYVAGYILKKMTGGGSEWERAWLKGRKPEFSRMSRRPGIGGNSVKPIAEAVKRMCMQNHIEATGDIPENLRIGGKRMPLGRYLKNEIREELHINTDEHKEKRMQKWKVEVETVLSDAIVSGQDSKKKAVDLYVDIHDQKRLQLTQRVKLFNRRNKI